MPPSATPLSRMPNDESTTGAEPRPFAADDELAGLAPRSGYAWLWPWVLASIGFLATLALLR